MSQHFDLAGDEIRIDRSLGPRPHEPGHCDAVFVAQLFCDGEGRGAVRVADDLHQPFAVAQVDEDDAAMIATAMDPTCQRNGLGEKAAVDAAAVVGAFHVRLRNPVR